MNKSEILTIKTGIVDPVAGVIGGQIKISDGIAISSFNDRRMTKKIFDAEKSSGNKNIEFRPIENAMIERFPGKTRDEIAEIILKQIEKIGSKAK